MGIEEIKDYIKKKVDEKVEEILRRANLVKEREISQAKKSLEEWIEEETKAFMREKIALVAKYKAKMYREVALERTRLQEEIWQDFSSRLKKKINEVRNDATVYSSFLLKCLSKAYEHCRGRSVELRVNPEDVDLMRRIIGAHYPDCQVKVSSDEGVSLGVILEDPENKTRINYDLVALMEAEKERMKTFLFKEIEK